MLFSWKRTCPELFNSFMSSLLTEKITNRNYLLTSWLSFSLDWIKHCQRSSSQTSLLVSKLTQRPEKDSDSSQTIAMDSSMTFQIQASNRFSKEYLCLSVLWQTQRLLATMSTRIKVLWEFQKGALLYKSAETGISSCSRSTAAVRCLVPDGNVCALLSICSLEICPKTTWFLRSYLTTRLSVWQNDDQRQKYKWSAVTKK